MSIEQLADLESLLRDWPDMMPDIASAAAPEIESAAHAMYARGEGPDGKHAPRKKDGALALQRPLSTVAFRSSDASIIGTAEDVLRYHQGPVTAARYPERKTFPSDGDPLPQSWADSIDEAAQQALEKAFERVR